MTMPQVGVDGRDSYGDSVNHKLDHMVGNREFGQLVQIGRANQIIPVGGRTVTVGPVMAVGVVTGAAFDVLDAIGTIFSFTVPKSGILQSATYFDRDDEGLAVALWLYRSSFTPTADNSPLAPSDADLLKVIDVLSFASFNDGNTGQVATLNGLGIAYSLAGETIYAQLQARGALNIAAGSEPMFSLTILADE